MPTQINVKGKTHFFYPFQKKKDSDGYSNVEKQNLGFFSYRFLIVAVLKWHEGTEKIVRASSKAVTRGCVHSLPLPFMIMNSNLELIQS